MRAALSLLLAAVFVSPALAQTTQVSNTGQTVQSGTTLAGWSGTSNWRQAQRFTTGDNAAGYTLSEVDLRFATNNLSTTDPTTLKVSIYSTTTSGNPDSSLHVLTNPTTFTDDAVNTFTAPSGTTLAASTTYALVYETTSTSSDPKKILFRTTTSNAEDSGAQSGWSISDTRLESSDFTTWSSQNHIFLVAIKGTAKTASTGPTITIAAGTSPVTEGTAASFTVTASEAPSADLVVNLTVSESENGDYVASGNEGSKTVTITASSTTATYSVDTEADTTNEPNGTVTVAVASGTGYTVGTTSSADVTVNDDDDDATISAVEITSSPAFGDTYRRGETIEVKVTWDEDVTWDVSANTNASLQVDLAIGSVNRGAKLVTGGMNSGTARSLLFRYTVVQADTDNDGVAVNSTTTPIGSLLVLTVNGATVKDSDAQAADRAHAGLSADASHKVDGSVVNSAPTVANAIPDQTATAGTAFSYAFPANTFNDANSDALSYSATKSDGTALPAWLGFTGSTRTFAGTPQAANAGTLSVKVTASDGAASVSDTFDIKVNRVPTVANAIPDQTATAGTAFSYAFPANTFSDADGDTLSYTATKSDGNALPMWLGFTDSTRTFAGTPQAANAGTLSVKVTADDGNGGTASDTFDIDVNRAPAFASTAVTRSVAENTAAGGNVGAAVTATDADSDTLTYTLGGTDAGSFGIGSSSGQITVGSDTDLNFEAKSSYSVTVTATDPDSATATATVTINVTDVDGEAPAAPSAPTVGATSGSNTSLDVGWSAPTNTGPAITGYDVRYFAGAADPTDPANWNDHTFTGTGTSTAIASLTAGTAYRVQVRAKNAEGTGDWSASGSGTTNSPTNNAPTVANAIPDQTATAGTAFSYAFPANTFNDADNDSLSYTATQSDGMALPMWLGFTDSTRTFAGTPAASDAGTVSVKVTASDGTASVSDTFDIDVNRAPAFASTAVTRSVAENTDAGGNVGAAVTATDADNDTLTYTLGGSDASSFEIGSASGQITVGSGTALDFEGAKTSYTVTVTASDGTDDATATVTITVTDVAEAPAAPSAPTVNATSGSTTSLDVSWSAPTNTGPAITDYDWRWQVQGGTSWTEKTDTTTTATSATITGLTAGTGYHVQVRATNDEGTGGWSASGSGTTNSPTNNAPTVANPIPDRTATVGTAFSYAFPANTFNDADGDTLSYTATQSDGNALPGWLTFTGSNRTFAGTPAAAGTLSVKVTASDGTASVSDDFDITVSPADTPDDTPDDTPPPVTPPRGGGDGGGGTSRPTPPPEPPPTVTVAPDVPDLAVGAPRLAATDDPATGETDERQANYTMALSRRPTGPVTVTPQSSDPAIATVGGPLTFSLADWDTPQTLAVTGVAPGRVEITLRLKGGGYDNANVPAITVIVGDGGADPRKALAPPPAPGEGEGGGQQPDDGGDNDGDSDGDGQPEQPDADDAGDNDGQPGQPGMNGDGDDDGQTGQAGTNGDGDNDGPPGQPGMNGDGDDGSQPEQPGANAAGVPEDTTGRDDPDRAPPAPRLPDGALAALARGHLASARQVLGPRLNPDAAARTGLTLAGQTLSLAQLLTPGDAGTAFNPDLDRAPDAAGLSWDQATGRCAAWHTASCATSNTDGLGSPVYGQPGAGPWDTLLYRLTTGLLQGTAGDALWRGSGFTLTLGGGDGPGAPGRRWTLWGRGHVQALAGGPAGFVNGTDLRTGYLGIDTRLGANARTGFALSRSLGAGAITTVHPYLSWSNGATTLSALGGIGRGRADPLRGTGTGTTGGDNPYDAYAAVDAFTDRPLGLRMGLVEVTRQLGVLGEITLDVRGDAAWAQMRADNGVEIQTEAVRTLRLGAGAGGEWQVGRLTLAPALETHLRHDSGHGPTGRGLEFLGGLSASHGEMRLTVQGRLLTTRSETATRERGLQTTLALGQPGHTGPSLALSARWGDAATGGDTLWREQLHTRRGHTRNNAWSVDARSEMGLRLPGGRLLTGFASLSHAGDGPRALVGLRLGLGAAPMH